MTYPLIGPPMISPAPGLLHLYFRDGALGYERTRLSVTLRYASDAKQRVQEMVRKEQACCSFLSFETREQVDEVWLTIKAPENLLTTLNILFEPFLPK